MAEKVLERWERLPRPTLISRAPKVLAHCRGNCDILGLGFLLTQSHPLLSEIPCQACGSIQPMGQGWGGLRAGPTWLDHCHAPIKILTLLGACPRKRPSVPGYPGDPKGAWGEEGVPSWSGGYIARASAVQSSSHPKVHPGSKTPPPPRPEA